MTQTHGAVLLRHIRKLVATQCPSRPADGQLLQQFISDRDEASFTALVQRHGSMVLGVCRGILHHQQDAEDVFQAAFLVLARKAGTIRKQQAVSSWLHGVAYRLALKARDRVTRRQDYEQPLMDVAAASTVDDLTLRELRVILHEELHRLPEKYRTALLLCYWEGKTRDQSADRLGMSADAFKKRLEQARNLLGSRLTRRGLVPSAAFFAALFSANGVQAAISHSLISSTAQAAVAFAAGGSSAGVPTAAAVLAEGVIRTMNITKWATVITLTLAIGGLGAGLGLWTYHGVQAQQPSIQAKAGAPQQADGKPQEKASQKTDQDRIVGTWRVVKIEADGDDPHESFAVLARFKFTKDGKAAMSFSANVVITDKDPGQYKLIAPGKIDVTFNAKADLSEGIYKFDGDGRFTICAAKILVGGGKRPSEFKGDKDSGQIVLVLTRCKPGEETPTAAEIAKYKASDAQVRAAVARNACTNSFKQIGIAMHLYHDKHGTLPAHAIYSKDGKTPLLSWRVAILPFIEHEALYNEFKLDEPWDSTHNKKLIAKMPRSYGAEGLGAKGEGLSYWQVVTGPDTLFDGAKKMKFIDITDGTSHTILTIEAKDPVIWTKPADLVLPKEKDKKLPVGGLFKNGFLMGMCDGSVRMAPHDLAPAPMRAFITPRGGDQP